MSKDLLKMVSHNQNLYTPIFFIFSVLYLTSKVLYKSSNGLHCTITIYFLQRLSIIFLQGHQEKNRSQRQGCIDSRGYDN